MGEQMEIRYIDDGRTTNSLLKFGKPRLDLGAIHQASMREEVQFTGLNAPDEDLSLAQAWEVRSARKQEAAVSELGSLRTRVLSVNIGGATRDYSARPEEGLFENSAFCIMCREGNRVILTPLHHWFALAPYVAPKNENATDEPPSLNERVPRRLRKFDQLVEVDVPVDKKAKENVPEGEEEVEKKKKTVDLPEDDYGVDSHKFETLSSDDSQENLNEEGKELERLLKKTNSPNDSDISSDEDSDGDSDFDALEKKYSNSSIFKSGKHFDTSKSDEASQSSDNLKPNTMLKEIQKFDNGKDSKSVVFKDSRKPNQMEMFVEEKIKKYLAHHNMNTITLLKKLLPHAPPGYTREEIVIAMAKVLKRIGVQKSQTRGNMYLDMTKK